MCTTDTEIQAAAAFRGRTTADVGRAAKFISLRLRIMLSYAVEGKQTADVRLVLFACVCVCECVLAPATQC